MTDDGGSGSIEGDRPQSTWREMWEVADRAYLAGEEQGRRKHAARQDRLRGGATSIVVREEARSVAARIIRRTVLAIALGIGVVFLARTGFSAIVDGLGDLGIELLAGAAAAAGTITFGIIVLRLAASVVLLVVRGSRRAVLARADEDALTLVADLDGDLPADGGPARFAWPEVKAIVRGVTYECKADEDPSPPPSRSAEHLLVVAHDGRIVRTLVDGPRRPWRRLMLIARDVGRVPDVDGIDNRRSLYTDTDPFRIRHGR